MSVAARFAGPGLAYEGLARRRSNGKPQWTGEVRVIDKRMYDPIRWAKPRRIFVNSMSDLFHEKVTIDTIADVWAVMALAPRHTYQILTKRPERMRPVLTDPSFYRRVLESASRIRERWPKLNMVPVSDPAHAAFYPQVWLGTSVEDQAAADDRIPRLLETPAAVRFLSMEPLLGPVDLHRIEMPPEYNITISTPGLISALTPDHEDRYWQAPARIDWVIVGGESGPYARPMDVQWARDIVRQCRAAGTAVFVKQMGRWIAGDDTGFNTAKDRWLFADGGVWVPGVIGEHNDRRPPEAIAFGLFDAKGGDMSDWPEDLRVREFPLTTADQQRGA